MAKTPKSTSTLSSQEQKDLESLGYKEGSPNTIPDNISPVLKSKLLDQFNKENGNVTSADMTTATETQNQMVRERAAADGDEDMQKVLETQQKDAEAAAQKNQFSSGEEPKNVPTAKRSDGSEVTAQRQNQSASKSQ